MISEAHIFGPVLRPHQICSFMIIPGALRGGNQFRPFCSIVLCTNLTTLTLLRLGPCIITRPNSSECISWLWPHILEALSILNASAVIAPVGLPPHMTSIVSTCTQPIFGSTDGLWPFFIHTSCQAAALTLLSAGTWPVRPWLHNMKPRWSDVKVRNPGWAVASEGTRSQVCRTGQDQMPHSLSSGPCRLFPPGSISGEDFRVSHKIKKKKK